MSESGLSRERIAGLGEELRALRKRDVAIALDFDGVCKLYTSFKHQIMFAGLFLNAREFQRVPFEDLRDAYTYINFRSPEYAGKERFLCVHALSERLAAQGHDCALPGLAEAARTIQVQGGKLNAESLQPFTSKDDVKRLLKWSREVNERVSQLTEIGLTPGLRESILDSFLEKADFYVVSTATEASLEESLRRDNVTFIKRYIGQETASKAEALLAMCHAGYDRMALFGDSLCDRDEAALAAQRAPEGAHVLFGPVIPGREKSSFESGRRMLDALCAGDWAPAEEISRAMTDLFNGQAVTVNFMDQSKD